MADGFVCRGLLNTKIRTIFKEAIKCVHLENDYYPGITHFNLCGYIYYTHIFFIRYVYFSHDAVFIGMKQQRLVMLYLSAIEQKKNEVTTIIALISNYVTI